MGQRGRSRARCDQDVNDNDSPSRRRTPLSEDEEGNEAAGGHPGVADILSLSSDEEVDKDALVELGEADPRRKDKKRKKKRRKERRKRQRKDDWQPVAASKEEEPQVAGTQEGEIGIAKSVLTEDGAPDNIVPRNILLMKKNHLRELFVSKNERIICDSFEAFVLKHLQGTARTLEVEVPGSKTNETYLVPAVVCRLCTKELARVFVMIFQARWSFSGDVDSQDLFVTPLGCVKISLEKMKDLVPADAENIKKDAARVALIVRNSIFDHAPLAFDITSFVTLLEDFNGNCKTLIHHPGLKEEVAKLCQFKVLYMRSVRIFQLDEVKHTRIMEKLPYVQVNKQHWKLKMETNIYFERILKYGKRTISQIIEPVAANQGHLLKDQILPATEAPPSKLERLTTSEDKERKSQGQALLLPASQGVQAQISAAQDPRHQMSQKNQAAKPQEYTIVPGLARQITRGTAADASLTQLMKPQIRGQSSQIMEGQAKASPLFGREAVEDVKALFQMLFDVISADYDDDGLALSRNVRNSLDHSVQPARAGPKHGNKRGTIFPEPATIRFNYGQIEHMIGCMLPNFLCQFYLAMADEDEIDSPKETAMSELCLGGRM